MPKLVAAPPVVTTYADVLPGWGLKGCDLATSASFRAAMKEMVHI
jgi:hypothetical protein